MANWREMITDEMKDRGDGWENQQGIAPGDDVLDLEFYDGFGCSEGPSFTLWTKDRVYFPVVYDGSEWVGSVARNPCDEASGHHGGE